jgi:hypothetical protein
VTAGIAYPLGAVLSSGPLRNGAAQAWLTARLAEGWVFKGATKDHGFTTDEVQCGLADFVQGLGI